MFFQDEARLGQQGTLTKIWARRGSRPSVVRQNGRKSVWVFGAVEPATGWSTAMVALQANTESMQAFLDTIGAKLRPREQGVMILDGAGWHRSKKLRWPKRLRPLYLPPYSPDLNAIERLWLWLRLHCWSNRCYTGELELMQVAIASHRRLTREVIKSVCAVSWLTPELLV